MLRKAFRRLKIFSYKLVIGKKSLRLIVRLASGNSGVVLYNRSLDFLTSLMGSSKESNMLFNRLRDIMVEFMILSSEREIRPDKIRSIQDRVKAAFEQLRKNCPTFPTNSFQKAVFAEAVQPMMEQFINEVTSILDEELKTSFAPATLRKVHKVSEQLSQPNVMARICFVDSPNNVILREMLPSAFQLETSTTTNPEVERMIRTFRGSPVSPVGGRLTNITIN